MGHLVVCCCKLMERVLLTEDTLEDLPVRGVKNPVRLAGGEHEWSGKPIVVEHLQWAEEVEKSGFDLSLWADKGQVEPNWRGGLQI